MKRVLLLMGLVVLAAIVAARLYRSDEGALRSTTRRTAERLREKGPVVIDRAAQGIEGLGEAAERGAQQVRQRVAAMQEEGPSETWEEADQRTEAALDASQPSA